MAFSFFNKEKKMLSDKNLKTLTEHTMVHGGDSESVGSNIQVVKILVEKYTKDSKNQEINALELENDLVELIIQTA